MRRAGRIFGLLLLLLAISFAAGCSGLPDEAVPIPEMPALGEPVPLPDDPPHQFDFWLGAWQVQNLHPRRGEWVDSGAAEARIQAVADGRAVLEQWNGTVNGRPLIGFSLRAYDPRLGKWVVYLNWHRGEPGAFSEMHGERRGERIEQFPPDDDRHLRYSFSRVREDSCQWDQAQSDDGQTWIPVWVMQFTRREASLPVDATNAPIVDPPAAASAHTRTRALDFLIGAWEGSARLLQPDGSWIEGAARARVTSMIDGFGLLQFLDLGEERELLAALAWDATVKGWVAVRADSDEDGLLRMQGEDPLAGSAVFVSSTEPPVRETWSCAADACTWRRETAASEGDSWATVIEAELVRAPSRAAWIAIPKARAPFPDVLTGGQPTAEELAWAARNGYRTVINLRAAGEDEELADEAGIVDALGMRYVTIPVAGPAGVSAENARSLAQALDAAAFPAIVHCRSGNRVGALFALKAHELDGVSAEEALEVGRRSGLTGLEPVVRERLGLPKKTEN